MIGVLPMRDSVLFPGLIQTILVGRPMSIRTLERAMQDESPVFVVLQRSPDIEVPEPPDWLETGTIAEVLHILPLPDGNLRVALRGLHRATFSAAEPDAHGWRVQPRIHTHEATGLDTEAGVRELRAALSRAMQLGLSIPKEVEEQIHTLAEPDLIADTLGQHLPMPTRDRQSLLEMVDTAERIQAVTARLKREAEVLQVQTQFRAKVEEEIGANHREFVLREQMRAIQKELSDSEPDHEIYLRWADTFTGSPLVVQTVRREASKLARIAESNPDAGVIRSYLDTLTNVPWLIRAENALAPEEATRALGAEHEGLAEVKDRLLDEIARLARTGRGTTLCLVGPPGVGKTSLAMALGAALGRPVERISLAGLRDEAELRGHRRTYVGAMPGRIAQAMIRSGVRNPVIILDELDKMALDGRGDPSHVLLEALDPRQATAFVDHYLEVPMDLSEVVWVLTANQVDTLSAPLRDRLTLISVPSYTNEEKEAILARQLWPRILADHGVDELSLSSALAARLVQDSRREPGVRGLQRRAERYVRRVVRQEWQGSANVEEDSLIQSLFGAGKEMALDTEPGAGRIRGLAVGDFGGSVLDIEVVVLPASNPARLEITGNLGETLRESALAALTLVRSQIQPPPPECDLHIHVGESGIPKDGPSAGLALSLAIRSALTGTPLTRDVAVTGAVNLHGHVLPVGGIEEKLRAADRAGITRVLVPQGAEHLLQRLPAASQNRLQVIPIRNLDEAWTKTRVE